MDDAAHSFVEALILAMALLHRHRSQFQMCKLYIGSPRTLEWAAQMTQLSEIYNARILELAASIPAAARLDNADVSASAHSKLCGSTVNVDLKMSGQRVTAFSQTVKACLLGQAAASVMAREIVGSTVAEIRDVGAEMRAMLKTSGAAPAGRWADLGVLEPVRDVKARHASTLLVFDAVDRAFDILEAKQRANSPPLKPALPP